jgi:hypothetical protein
MITMINDVPAEKLVKLEHLLDPCYSGRYLATPSLAGRAFQKLTRIGDFGKLSCRTSSERWPPEQRQGSIVVRRIVVRHIEVRPHRGQRNPQLTP